MYYNRLPADLQDGISKKWGNITIRRYRPELLMYLCIHIIIIDLYIYIHNVNLVRRF